jgi:hypothetical protein
MNRTNSTGNKSRSITILFAIAVLVPSLYGFGGKFIEFVNVFRGDSDGAFAVTPIVNYLLATLGFFCLFGWALLRGMFSDIERPKHTLLEIEEWLDGHSACTPTRHQTSQPPAP